jgi:hypothetical protein
VGGGAGGKFAEGRQEAGGAAGVVEGVELDRGRKLRRIGPETHLQYILLPYRHQSAQFRSRIVLPMSAGSQNDRSGLVDVPMAFVALTIVRLAASGAPAMADDLQMEAGRAAKIGFKGQSLFLLPPCAQQPMYWKGARPELHGDAGIFKAAGAKLQAGIEAGTGQPAGVDDASLAAARRIDPAQRFSPPATVIAGKQEIPDDQHCHRADHVYDQNASHVLLSSRWYF